MSARVPGRLPAASVAPGDVIRRAGKWREVVQVTAGVGLFDGLVELHTEGPYVRPWPLEVDATISAMVEPSDLRLVTA